MMSAVFEIMFIFIKFSLFMAQKNTCKDAFIQRLGVGRRACTIIALICAIGMFLSSSGTIMLASEVRMCGQAVIAMLLFFICWHLLPVLQERLSS